MQSIFQLFDHHASVRDFLIEKEIPEADVTRITDAAQRASSSYNLQLYSIVSVTATDLRSNMSRLCGDQAFIRDASLFFVFCADLYRSGKACEYSGYRFFQKEYFESTLMAVIDASLSAENAALAAEALGYGICFIGAVRDNTEEIRRLLDLPELVFPLFGLCIGYPAKRNRPKSRLPGKGVFFTNSYRKSEATEAMEKYDRTMIESGIYENRHFPDDECEKIKEVSDALEYGWIEHSARRVSTKKSAKARPGLRKDFEKAGFGFK